jgi:oligopeptidase B
MAASPLAEPQAEQHPLECTLHDLRLIDEYAWLKAENCREVMRDPSQLDPAIRAYLQAERCAMNQSACHLNAG